MTHESEETKMTREEERNKDHSKVRKCSQRSLSEEGKTRE